MDNVQPSSPEENHRRHDPHTSVARAHSLDSLGNKKAILHCLDWAGARGMTTGELSDMMGRERAKFSSQVTQLRYSKHVFYAGFDRDGQQVWIIETFRGEWSVCATPRHKELSEEQSKMDAMGAKMTSLQLRRRLLKIEKAMQEIRDASLSGDHMTRGWLISITQEALADD